ncbi:MAG TPA: hypothetical protein ENK90_01740, partial [Epsilonproteobacteria bacterium]|nr:hypothetical protein [Campylobacterota bacterium]
MQIMKKIFSVIAALLLLVLIYLSFNLIQMGDAAKVYKSDYATLHSVEFGMFNSDVWTDKITQIIDKKIENFDLNTSNRNEIKGYIETIIDTLVSEAERVVRERNKGKRGFLDSILGSTKQMITDSIIDFKDLRKRVPEFTDAVISEAEKPTNQQRAKKVIREKLKAFMNERFQRHTDMRAYDAVIQKYHADNLTTCNTVLDTKMHTLQKGMHSAMILMLLVVAVIIPLIIFQGSLTAIGLFLLSGTT